MHLRFLIILPIILLTSACSHEQSDSRYSVDIRWTSYGIPHVLADDWGSLGYGFAYAASVDGVCVFAKELATANGTLSRDFGASDEHFASDVFHRSILTEERLTHHRSALSAEAVEYNDGFTEIF